MVQKKNHGSKKILDKCHTHAYNDSHRSLGGSSMSNRNRNLNSLLISEALLASFLGLFLLKRPVVHRSMLRL